MGTHLHVHHPEDHEARIDVFFYLQLEDGLTIPGGVATDEGYMQEWLGVEPAIFEGIHGARPYQFDEFLTHMYGDWRTPQRGIDWHWGNRTRRQNLEYALTPTQIAEVESFRQPGRQGDDLCEKR